VKHNRMMKSRRMSQNAFYLLLTPFACGIAAFGAYTNMPMLMVLGIIARDRSTVPHSQSVRLLAFREMSFARSAGLAVVMASLKAVFQRPYFRQTILAACGIGLVLWAWRSELGAPREKKGPDTVGYHYGRLKQLRNNVVGKKPASVKALFHPRALNWYLEGRPTIQEQYQRMETHQAALIRLGYFERRDFPWKGNLNQLGTAVLKAMKDNRIDFFPRIETQNGYSDHVFVTTRKEDMPAIGRLIRKLEAELRLLQPNESF
jgi:hypothetical protein